ncbi:hypothetical protein HD554DRAFT_2178754 [Boletus coccyginus]|nr:hypothetical protein HD554DRAFT_2178754 [Boletus coccyginus]
MTVLYRCAEWHALAKLRMHTEASLSLLNKASKQLGSILRKFRDETAEVYRTLELPREYAARQRQRHASGPSKNSSGQSTPKPKGLNLKTYKFHAIGDYERTVTQFGTTDSYTTQIGELAHRTIKESYSLTNKNNALRQITKHEVRRRQFRSGSTVNAVSDDLLPTCEPELHHSISDTSRNPLDIFPFLREHEMDPAVKCFIPKLKDHLLYRLLNLEFEGEDHIFTDDQRNCVRILDNRLYSVACMQVNYTTYDVHREQDIINPHTHSSVMVLLHENKPGHHAYWYARMLHVFHAYICPLLWKGLPELQVADPAYGDVKDQP